MVCLLLNDQFVKMCSGNMGKLLRTHLNCTDFQVSFEDDKIENLDFRIIRIMSPLKLLRNGKTVSKGCVAFCSFSTTFVS